MRAKTVGINIRVTEQEKKRIERFAKKCGLSVSEYLRQLANGHTPNEIPSDNFFTVAHYLQMITEDFKGIDDEKFVTYVKGCVSDLYATYLNSKGVNLLGNN
ncbi:MAG: hypothetical protein BGN88_06120 [Clostridiales bacterium 43-6]|nr:MAG: hypothetical protein BGN88_06120 [Clostridiales bacterium 43-6]